MFFLIIPVIGTASEGEPLGKRYSTLWTPLRTAFSVSLLIPLPGLKISLLQVLLLKMIYMGIGGAGYMTSKAYDYINDHAGFTSSSKQINNSKEIALKILKPLTIQAYYENDFYGRKSTWLDTLAPVEVKTKDDGVLYYKYEIGFPLPDALDVQLDDEVMGKLVVDCGKKKRGDKSVCDQRVDSAVNLRDDMIDIALQIVANHKHIKGFKLSDTFKNLTDDEIKAKTEEITSAIKTADITQARDKIAIASQRYTQDVYAAILKDVNKAGKKHKAKLAKAIAKAKDQGFGALGTWYWAMANFNEKASEIYKDSLSFQRGDYSKIKENSYNDLEGYMGRLQGIEDEEKRQELVDLAGSSEETSEILKAFKGFATVDASYKSITDGDPVANLQNYGHNIINATVSAVVVFVGAKAYIDGYNSTIVGIVQNLTTGTAKAVKSLAASAAPFILLMIIPLMMLGMTLAFYLPAVPFILWTMALIGWLMLVIESLIAAPLWAAAHAIPEGEGMSGQHGKQGYMLFLNVLMRPPLMVFGFFIAVVLMQAIGNFVGNSFSVFASGMNAKFLQGAITFFTMMFVVGGIIVVAAHKVFGLVTWLPDNVMRWVGQQVQNLGEGNDEQRTRTIFAGAATSGGGAASQGLMSGVKPKPKITPGTDGDGGGGDKTPTAKDGADANQGKPGKD